MANFALGGLSFFSKRYGLAMDGIINHEVVLGNGTIVNANATSNADLHKALKGGSGNFGIVTRFDLNSWKQDKIWGGIMIHSPFQQKNSLKFLELVSQKSADPGVHILQAFSTYSANASVVSSHQFFIPTLILPRYQVEGRVKGRDVRRAD